MFLVGCCEAVRFWFYVVVCNVTVGEVVVPKGVGWWVWSELVCLCEFLFLVGLVFLVIGLFVNILLLGVMFFC